jgi:hypothetical protein
VQAMLEDGGYSFKCVQSSAWRKDSECYEGPSDFMTAGERYGLIPAVPKGFVRWVQLSNINAPSARKHAADRKVHYIYCGDANVVPDTAGWEPFDGKLAAAMKDKQGSQRISSLRPRTQAGHMSVERWLREYPLLKSAGVTLDDFSFTIARRSSSAKLAPSQAAAPTAVQASPVPVQPPLPSLEEAAAPTAVQASPVPVQPPLPSLEEAAAPTAVQASPVPVQPPLPSLEGAAAPTAVQASPVPVQPPLPSLEAVQASPVPVQPPLPSLEAVQASPVPVQPPLPSLEAVQASPVPVQPPLPSLEEAAPPVSVAPAAQPRLNLASLCLDRYRTPPSLTLV